MPVLKLTLDSGDVVETPFDKTATLTVTTKVQIEPSVFADRAMSWSEIVGIEIADDPEPAAAPAPEAPADPSGSGQTPSGTSSSSGSDPGTSTDGEGVTSATSADAPNGPSTVTSASPAEVLANAAALPVPDAVAHLDAALAKWPDDADLLAAKADLNAALTGGQA